MPNIFQNTKPRSASACMHFASNNGYDSSSKALSSSCDRLDDQWTSWRTSRLDEQLACGRLDNQLARASSHCFTGFTPLVKAAVLGPGTLPEPHTAPLHRSNPSICHWHAHNTFVMSTPGNTPHAWISWRWWTHSCVRASKVSNHN